MRKRLSLGFALLLLPLLACAQSPKFGYFSYERVLKSMSEYIAAERDLASLKAQYDAEAKRSEDDFNAKYVEFLEEQDNLASSIRKKRQAELVDLMEKNTAFKTQAQQLIRDAETKALAPVRAKLNAAVKEVGKEHGYAYILNIDNNAVPFVNADYGEDTTLAIEQKLR